MQVNINEAKTKLSKLIARAIAGEDVVIAKAGKPVVKLTRLAPQSPPKGKRILGGMEGKIKFIDPDWDKPMTAEEVKKFFNL